MWHLSAYLDTISYVSISSVFNVSGSVHKNNRKYLPSKDIAQLLRGPE